jgi:hypothetical protein
VESLYKSVPETNKFTRSLSNPEMVKKIQQDRLKQKFIKISTKEGGKQFFIQLIEYFLNYLL